MRDQYSVTKKQGRRAAIELAAIVNPFIKDGQIPPEHLVYLLIAKFDRIASLAHIIHDSSES